MWFIIRLYYNNLAYQYSKMSQQLSCYFLLSCYTYVVTIFSYHRRLRDTSPCIWRRTKKEGFFKNHLSGEIVIVIVIVIINDNIVTREGWKIIYNYYVIINYYQLLLWFCRTILLWHLLCRRLGDILGFSSWSSQMVISICVSCLSGRIAAAYWFSRHPVHEKPYCSCSLTS